MPVTPTMACKVARPAWQPRPACWEGGLPPRLGVSGLRQVDGMAPAAPMVAIAGKLDRLCI